MLTQKDLEHGSDMHDCSKFNSAIKFGADVIPSHFV